MIDLMLRTILLALLSLPLVFLQGCGGQTLPLDCGNGGCGAPMPTPTPAPQDAITFTAADVFNPHVGDVWHFVNGYGRPTTVTLEAAPNPAAGDSGTHIVLHFTKTNCADYWGLGICGAEDRFLLGQVADGRGTGWRGLADVPTLPQSCPWCNGHTAETINWRPVPGNPVPFVVVPGFISSDRPFVDKTIYGWWLWQNGNTFDDIVASGQGVYQGQVTWESDFSVETISVPAYTGPVVSVLEKEGPCTQEKWSFAPGLGLVQIINVRGADCGVPDPNLTIRRVP